MSRVTFFKRAVGATAFFGFAMVIIFMAVLPLDHLPGALPGPDLLLAAAIVWVIRRPDLAPLPIITVAFLMADILWMRPIGLTTAAVVVGTEYLRRNGAMTIEVPFIYEWTVAASVIAAITIGSAAVLSITGAHSPGVGALLIKLIGTIAIYPVMVAVARFGFGIQKPGRRQGFGYEAPA